MHPQTEQLLGTLEILCSNTFVWESTIQGDFTLWNLMSSEGFVHLTDVELAFEHWQNIEEWGTPTNQEKFDYEYAPTRSERKNDIWNKNIAQERKNYYQQLLNIIKTLQNLQAYNLWIPSISKIKSGHPDYFVSIVVGKTDDNHWLCLAPIVPDQVSSYGHDENRNQSKKQPIIYPVKLLSENNQIVTTQIQSILDKITPITIYGYYHGAYNYTYQHHIVGALAETKITAIATALQIAKMVVTEKITVEYANDDYNSRKLSQFMNKCLRDRTLYNISFWDLGYIYEVGQTPVGDWIGTRSQNEFEYNP